eukprot:4403092-Heterocapsa_arctica.AAC.1
MTQAAPLSAWQNPRRRRSSGGEAAPHNCKLWRAVASCGSPSALGEANCGELWQPVSPRIGP